MFASLLAILTLPYFDLSRTRGLQFKPASKVLFFILAANLILLMVLGAKHVESPFVEIGMMGTFVYFAYYLINIPSLSLIENTLLAIVQNGNKHLVALYNNPLPFQGYYQQSNLGGNILNYLTFKVIELTYLKNKHMEKYILASLAYTIFSCIFFYYFGDSFIFALDTTSNFSMEDETIPGVICPTCEAEGIQTIVIRGRTCPKCRTEIE